MFANWVPFALGQVYICAESLVVPSDGIRDPRGRVTVFCEANPDFQKPFPFLQDLHKLA